MLKICFPCFRSCEGESRATRERLRVQWEDGGVRHEGCEDSKPDSHPAPAQPDAAPHQPPPSGDPPRPPEDAWPGPVSHTKGLPCGRRQWGSPAPSRLRHQPSTVPAVRSCSLVPGPSKSLRSPSSNSSGYTPSSARVTAWSRCHSPFVIMSRRTTLDYASVLHTIVEALPAPPAVTTVTTDFEPAIWQGVRRILRGVDVRGCRFHWAQAVERQFGKKGLMTAYTDHSGPPSSAVGTDVPPACRDTWGLRETGGRRQGTWGLQARRLVRLRLLYLVRIWHMDSFSLVSVQ